MPHIHRSLLQNREILALSLMVVRSRVSSRSKPCSFIPNRPGVSLQLWPRCSPTVVHHAFAKGLLGQIYIYITLGAHHRKHNRIQHFFDLRPESLGPTEPSSWSAPKDPRQSELEVQLAMAIELENLVKLMEKKEAMDIVEKSKSMTPHGTTHARYIIDLY